MILVTICGRGGSKGVKGKNIRQINGLPLIAYSIRIAFEFAKKNNCKVSISTDSDEIISVARQFGLYSDYKRPTHLATDVAGKVSVYKDLLMYEEALVGRKFEYILDLDITSPLRTIKDLENALDVLKADEDAINLFSVSKARKNPYFNMVELDEKGYCSLSKKLDNSILSRQTAPKVFELNASFYFFRRIFFDEGYPSVLTPRSLVYEMHTPCLDIDDELEFEIVKYLIETNKVETL